MSYKERECISRFIKQRLTSCETHSLPLYDFSLCLTLSDIVRQLCNIRSTLSYNCPNFAYDAYTLFKSILNML